MAGIIKADSVVATDGVQPIAFDFADMRQQAHVYLQSVQAQADQMIADARSLGESERAEALQKMQQQANDYARDQMAEQLQNQLASLIPAIQQGVQKLEAARQEWVAQWEVGVVKLALAIAERIVQRELDQPATQLELIRRALQLAAGKHQVILELNPSDLQTLQTDNGEHSQALREQLQAFGDISLVGDASIEKGGCKLKTEYGEVDQQLSSMIERIGEELSWD